MTHAHAHPMTIERLKKLYHNTPYKTFATYYMRTYLASDASQRLELNRLLLVEWRSARLIERVGIVFLFDAIDAQAMLANNEESAVKLISYYQQVFEDKWPLVEHILLTHASGKLREALKRLTSTSLLHPL